MSLLLIKARRLMVLALISMGFAGGYSGSVLALSCTPPVSFDNTLGFDLGCAAPTLWSVLSINGTGTNPTGTPLLQFTNGGTNGTQGATGNVGAVTGVQVKADNSSVFAGNLVVQTGTNTSGVTNNGPPDPPIVFDNTLLAQARTDAISAASLATGLWTNSAITNKQNYLLIDASHVNGQKIQNATTFYAKQDGLNVIQVTGIDLDGVNDILTFSAIGLGGTQYKNVEFVVNVVGNATTGNFYMQHQAKVALVGGTDAFNYSDLLFNIQGTTQTVNLKTGAQAGGIIMNLGGNVYMDEAQLFGEVIGGKDIGVWNESRVTNNAASQSSTFSGCTVSPTTGELTCIIRTAPEPGTIALLVLGLLGIYGASMRRRGRPLSMAVAA